MFTNNKKTILLFLFSVLLCTNKCYCQNNAIRVSSNINYERISKGILLDQNFSNPKIYNAKSWYTDLKQYIVQTYCDSVGKLKYYIAWGTYQSNGKYTGGGIFDTLGISYHPRFGESIYSGIFPLGSGQVLLLDDSCLIVHENNLNDTISVYNRGFKFSERGFDNVKVYDDTLYAFTLSEDSLKWLKAAPNYLSKVYSFPISKFYSSKKATNGFYSSIDFSKNMDRIVMSLSFGVDTIQNLLVLSDFDAGKNKFSNVKIIKDTTQIKVSGFGNYFVQNAPIIVECLFSPNDSIIYYQDDALYENPDIPNKYFYTEYSRINRYHIHTDSFEIIEDYPADGNMEEYQLFKTANNKICFFKDVPSNSNDYRIQLYEISYPDEPINSIDKILLFSSENYYDYWYKGVGYYQPFIETRMVRRCPTPVFTSSHEQKPDSIHYTLYNADSVIVATGSGESFAPEIDQAGKYHLLTTHYRAGFRQFLWSKYYLDVPIKPTFSLEDTLSCRFKALNLKNNTVANVNHPDSLKYEWNLLGAQNQTYNVYNPKIEPKFAGKYSLTLKVANGKCVYTSAPFQFEIQNANSADYTIFDTAICLNEEIEIKLKNATSILDSIVYKYNQSIENTSNFTFKPQRAGWHIIESKTYSKGGCVNTFADSFFVKHGFNKHDSIAITWLSTTSDSTIKFNAVGTSYLAKALLNINAKAIDSFESTPLNYIDSISTIHSINSYNIRAVDSCGNTLNSQHQNNIVLHVAQDEKQVLKAEWNKYLNLDNALYILEISFDGINWVEQATTNQLDVDVSLNAIWPNKYAFFRVKLEPFGQQPIYSNMVYFKTKPQLFIPNAFSPNGDGVNDSFYVSNYGYVKSGRFRIFSRNGQNVFGTDLVDFSWNGSNSISEPMPTGAYYFTYAIINFKNEEELFSGVVFLIR